MITTRTNLPRPPPALTPTPQPDTTTIHSTSTTYRTVTIIRSSAPPAPVSITDYLSTTIPVELLPGSLTQSVEEPAYTVQTSTNAADPSSSFSSTHVFPTMSLNGTGTGIFYSAPMANSTLANPTPFFPNTTSGRPGYVVPTFPGEVNGVVRAKLGGGIVVAMAVGVVGMVVAA